MHFHYEKFRWLLDENWTRTLACKSSKINFFFMMTDCTLFWTLDPKNNLNWDFHKIHWRNFHVAPISWFLERTLRNLEFSSKLSSILPGKSFKHFWEGTSHVNFENVDYFWNLQFKIIWTKHLKVSPNKSVMRLLDA